MKLITANGAVFGPFNNVIVGNDKYIADGVTYQFSVLGDSHSCIEANQEYAGEKPSERIPICVTSRQARQFLLSNDLLDSVNELLSSLPGKEGESARIDWEFSTEIYRSYPLVISMAEKFGWSSSKLDDFFLSASKL